MISKIEKKEGKINNLFLLTYKEQTQQQSRV
jgi:hypothetical protein